MSNSGKVKCTCGWSWNKSDSSKKDMYICHECGRDNSNNMKNGGWLDSYADGGTMQEHQENYNDSEVSLPEGFVGMGNNTKGRDYSPAWGGQFQMGGFVYPVNYVPQAQEGKELTFLQPTSDKLPEGYRIPYSDPSSERAMSIGGENGEPAYLIPSFKYGKPLYNPIGEFRKTKEHLGGPFKTYQEADEWERTVRHPAVERKETIMFPQEKFAMGGSIPGAVGFSYARVGAPSKGPRRNQTDVTDASAQNGKEMKYYQEGLDFKPKSISKNGGWLSKYDVAQAGAQVEYGTPEYEEAYNKGEVITDEGGRSPILLDEVVVEGKPLTEFGKTRKEIAAKNKWEDYAQKYLGNFEKNMGQTLENLPESRKQEYEDYVNKLAFDEYVKTHPQLKGEERGAYIDRMQAENANSSNFERAYEANADYNDATDVNKWRRGLIGLGSLVLPKPAMDYMKQESDYFSKKEKQAMIDNPISTQVGDVLGTLEPLTVPVESLYGDKSFGDIASGQSANIPMTARILGDPLMLGFEAAPLIGSGFRTAGRLLGTEEGLLSNAWKLNSAAEKLNNANSSYRVAGLNALEDFNNTGVLRSQRVLPGNATFLNRLQARPTPFPSFQKGYADMRYANPEGSVVFKTALPTFKRGDINPVTGLPIKGRHYAHRVINPETGAAMAEIPAADIRVFGDKPHWWQGYKPIEVPTSSLKNSYPSFKQITNAPENINAEHLAGLIKREADWLRSPEYLKRKMNATGRSEASIKKESEEIINHINNTSIDYTGTNESNVVGLYSSGKNPKIRVFDGIPEYPYSDHPFYTGTLDHEVKHAFSESAYTSDKALDFIQNTGYKNYPKANLNKTFGDRVKSAFDKNWANLSAEQQVTGRRMMDVIEKDQGIKRGTELTDANIDQLVESLKLNRYVDDDIYHVATQFKRKFGDDYKKHLKDFLNKAWMSVPAVIGLDAASETDKKKDGGIIKDDMGYWNPDNWGSPVEIGSTDITMEGVYEPLLGISDTGDTKLMKPGKNYKFKGKKVTEFPMAKNGLRQEQKGLVNLDQLTNFTNYNKPQPGGWLNKYN